nr:helix-turn-helix transcriptional regulator [Blautia obeum]
MKKIHKGAEITIEDICDEFEIRRTKLYEISNHSFGMGISEHIRRMRVKVACDLLRNTEDRVSDIATEVGIPDYNYFTKVFKKAMGVTPREYRKSMRKQT